MSNVSETLGDMLAIVPEGITPFSYFYFKGLKERKVYIIGAIDESLVEYAILPLLEMGQDKDQPIDMYVCTPGGEITYAFCIADILDQIEAPVRMHLIGMVASAGMYIAMAGYNNPNVTTICHASTIGMMHAGSYDFAGEQDKNQVKDFMEFQDRYDRFIRQYTLAHSKIDADYYDSIARKEQYLFPDELVELGIVDEIL